MLKKLFKHSGNAKSHQFYDRAGVTKEQFDAQWMPFTGNREFKQNPRMIVAAEGRYLTAAGITLAAVPGEPAKRPFEAAMKCWEKGFYVRYGGDTLQLGLPFSTTPKEIDLLVNAMGGPINETD